jgi:hypothetical protein
MVYGLHLNNFKENLYLSLLDYFERKKLLRWMEGKMKITLHRPI